MTGLPAATLSVRMSVVVALAVLLGLSVHVLLTSWSYQQLADDYWTQRLERQVRYIEGIMAWFEENDRSESGISTVRWVRELIDPGTAQVYRFQVEEGTGRFVSVGSAMRWSNVAGAPTVLDPQAMQVLRSLGDKAAELQFCRCGAYRVVTFRGSSGIVQFGLPVSLNAELLAGFNRDALVSAGVALMVALLLSLVAGYRLMRPLLRLAQRVETLDADTALPEVNRRDEVGLLARALARGLTDLAAARLREQRFVAAASHELRTPVAALVLDSDRLLRVARQGQSAYAELERIHRTVRRLHELTLNLLTLNRSKLTTSQRQAVDLLSLCSDVADELMPLAVERGLSVEVSGSSVTVLGDPVALGQVVSNVLGNAIKFSDHGSVTLHVAPDGSGAQLVIEDSGIGFALDADLTRLTQPFERGAGASAARPGAGLGLAVVAAVLAQHSGQISLERRAVGGARVVVWLPTGVNP